MPHPFIVASKLTADVILGIDFLKKYRGTVDLGNNQVSFNGNAVKIHSMVHNPTVKNQEDIDDFKDIPIEIKTILKKYPNLTKLGDGKIEGYRHIIQMKDERPFKKFNYPIPQIYMSEVKNELEKMLQENIVSKEPTDYISPLIVTKRSNGKIRICLGARLLNQRMSGDYDQPPNIEDILSSIDQSKFFSAIDLTNAFWSIKLEKKTQENISDSCLTEKDMFLIG